MSLKIGILQTGRIDGDLGTAHGQYPEMFMELLAPEKFDYETFAVVDGQFPASPNDCDGWVITGSKHGAYEDHDWIPPLEEFVRDLVKSGQPTVGICFGHQIMAQALGGKVEKYAKGWGIGIKAYQHQDGSDVKMLAFHQDQVITPPANTETFLSADYCAYAGLKYSPTCFSLQPHPEHSLAFSGALIEVRRPILTDVVADQALASLTPDNDQVKFGQMMADVLSGRLTL